MLIPSTINKKILKLYQTPITITKTNRYVFAEDFAEWDRNLPKTLRELCIKSIAHTWAMRPLFKEIPQLADRLFLLDVLATDDIQLEVSVPIIDEDLYWKRCYERRWPKHMPENYLQDVAYHIRSFSDGITEFNNQKSEDDFSRTWKHHYLEMYVKELLEHLNLEQCALEAVKLISSICAPYISVLHLSQLQRYIEGSQYMVFSNVLGEFYNLKELAITFQQTYVKDAFSWDNFKMSLNDIQYICKAIEKMPKLKTLKSDVNCEKFIMLLRFPFIINNTLKEINFWGCKISDEGVKTLCNILNENYSLEKIVLANNKIGLSGAKAFSEIISRPCTSLRYLDLRLNNIGTKGGIFLFEALTSPSLNLEYLIVAGCGIKDNSCLGNMLSTNDILRHLDLSNNRFDEVVGEDILKGLELNMTLTECDLRMCNLSSETKHAVKILLERNRHRSKNK